MSKSEKVALLYNQDIPVGRLLIPLEVDYMVNSGEYYRRIGYDFEKDAAIFLRQKEQSPLMEKYWDYDAKDWTPLTKSEMNAGAFGPQPGYTLTIERAQELLAGQDKKIIELTDKWNFRDGEIKRLSGLLEETERFKQQWYDEAQRLKGIADSAMKANDEMLSSRGELYRENDRLYKENESLKGHISFLNRTQDERKRKIGRLEKDIVELTEVNQRERSRAIESDIQVEKLKEKLELSYEHRGKIARSADERYKRLSQVNEDLGNAKKQMQVAIDSLFNEKRRLEKVLSEISITADNATKQKANQTARPYIVGNPDTMTLEIDARYWDKVNSEKDCAKTPSDRDREMKGNWDKWNEIVKSDERYLRNVTRTKF